MSSHRKARVEDFHHRVASSPDSVYQHRTTGWSYIPVHHFADESNTTVPMMDCWCLLGTDAALVECVLANTVESQPGLYARMDAGIAHWPKLQAVLTEPLTRATVEKVMQCFVDLGFPDPLLSRLQPGGPRVMLFTPS